MDESELRRVARSARRRALHEQAQWLYAQAKEANEQRGTHELSDDAEEAAYFTGLHEAFTLAAQRAHRMAEESEL
jgi:hypothetical protein